MPGVMVMVVGTLEKHLNHQPVENYVATIDVGLVEVSTVVGMVGLRAFFYAL